MEKVIVDFSVMFQVGERLRWKNLTYAADELDIQVGKWYDGKVHAVFGNSMVITIVSDSGREVNVPYCQYGHMAAHADIEMLEPKLHQGRLMNHLSLERDELYAEFERKKQIIEDKYRSLMNIDFAEWFKTNKEAV